MVLITLILILFVSLFFIYLIFNKELLSPSVTSITVFLFSLIILLFNKQNWGIIDLRIKTALVIITGIAIVVITETIIRIIFQHNNKTLKYIKSSSRDKLVNVYSISNTSTYIIIFVIFIQILYQYYCIKNISQSYGQENNILLGYRQAIKIGFAEQSSTMVLNNIIINSFGYYFTYLYMSNLIFLKKKKNYFLIPIIQLLISIALSSARLPFINYTIFSLVLYYILIQQRNGWNRQNNKKFIKKITYITAALLLCFYFLGYLTQKSSGKNIFHYLSIYTSASIPALDEFIAEFNYESSNFGKYTLMGIENILEKLDLINSRTSGNRNMEFIKFGNRLQRTNVYTCYGRLIHDYGYGGMLIFRFMWAIFYSAFYLKIRYYRIKKNEGIFIFFLALLFHSMIMQAIDETFLKNTLGISILTQFLFMFLLFKATPMSIITIKQYED